MIETKQRSLDGEDWREGMYWREVPKHHTHADCLFNFSRYRINGRIFNSNTKAFVEAFEKERMWEQLSD